MPEAMSEVSPRSTWRDAAVSTKYSDLTLVCEEREFKVHRVVVCAQSTVLAAACDRNCQV